MTPTGLVGNAEAAIGTPVDADALARRACAAQPHGARRAPWFRIWATTAVSDSVSRPGPVPGLDGGRRLRSPSGHGRCVLAWTCLTPTRIRHFLAAPGSAGLGGRITRLSDQSDRSPPHSFSAAHPTDDRAQHT